MSCVFLACVSLHLDYRLSVGGMESRLTVEEHAQVRSHCLGCSKGKQVHIIYQLGETFRPYVMRRRLMPKGIGIHPANRGGAATTAFAVLLRGEIW